MSDVESRTLAAGRNQQNHPMMTPMCIDCRSVGMPEAGQHPREGLPMKLRKRVRKLERRLDALTTRLPDNGIPTEPLDAQQLWREQVERYEHGTDDTEEWNLRGYL